MEMDTQIPSRFHFPQEMMEDHVWIDRQDYEDAEARYQIFLSEMVKNYITKQNAHTQTEQAALIQPTEGKVAFPVEMMYDSVWTDRLEYEEAEVRFHENLPSLTGAATSGFPENSAIRYKSIGEQYDDKNSTPVQWSGNNRASNDLGSVSNEHVTHSVSEINVQTQTDDELLDDMPCNHTVDSMQKDDIKELKTSLITLTKFVSTLSMENTKLKNRLSNTEARIEKLVKNTPQKSVDKKVATLESHIHDLEQQISHAYSVPKSSVDVQYQHAIQLEKVRQEMLHVYRVGNQSLMETVHRLEKTKQDDKQQFDGAMESLRYYLQHKDTEHKEDLKKMKTELEGYFDKKSKSMNDLIKKIRKELQTNDDTTVCMQDRIKEIESMLSVKNTTGTHINKENRFSMALYSSSINSSCDEKPDTSKGSSTSSVTSSADFISGPDMTGSLGKANNYMDYFQQNVATYASIVDELPYGPKPVVPSDTNSVSSWTKATGHLPAVIAPGVKYTASLSESTTASKLKNLLPQQKTAKSENLSHDICQQIGKELEQLLLSQEDKCILLSQLPGIYQAKMGKLWTLKNNDLIKVLNKNPNVLVVGKEENALMLYISAGIYPSYLLVNQCIRILDECEGFNANMEEIVEILMISKNINIRLTRISREIQKYPDFFQQDGHLIRLTMKAKYMLLRDRLAMILKMGSILMSDVGNKITKVTGWQFSLQYYGVDSMKKLIESFGPEFVKIMTNKNKAKIIQLGSFGWFYFEMKSLLESNGGALPLNALNRRYTGLFRKELLFKKDGCSNIDEFVSTFNTHFKILGDKTTRTLVLIETLTKWEVISEPMVGSVVALDCEMVGVRGIDGSEVGRAARCGIVDFNLEVIYDKYIIPEEKIISYRTPYSGIKKEHLKVPNAIPFKVAREEIMKLLRDKIVVGHSLYHDFESLKFSWPKRNRRDLSECSLLSKEKKALKELTSAHLKRNIQIGSHDPVEDSIASMELYKLVHVEWERELLGK